MTLGNWIGLGIPPLPFFLPPFGQTSLPSANLGGVVQSKWWNIILVLIFIQTKILVDSRGYVAELLPRHQPVLFHGKMAIIHVPDYADYAPHQSITMRFHCNVYRIDPSS